MERRCCLGFNIARLSHDGANLCSSIETFSSSQGYSHFLWTPIRNTPLVHWQQIVSCAVLLLVCFIFFVLVPPSVPSSILLQTKRGSTYTQRILPISLTLVPAVFPLFGVQMYNKLGYQWATSVLAFLTVVMMPFPYLFFKYGKRIRGRSRFAKSK